MPGRSTPVLVRVPQELLTEMDERAGQMSISRTQYILDAVRKYGEDGGKSKARKKKTPPNAPQEKAVVGLSKTAQASGRSRATNG